MDSGTDKAPDGRWLTYAELAAARRIDKHSAVRLVIRRQWRRQKDNRGLQRIFVPSDWLPPDTAPDRATDTAPDLAPDMSRAISALEATVAALREAKDGEIATLRDTVSRTETRAAHAEQRANQAEAALAQIRFRADVAEAQADELRDALEQAWAAAQEAQEAAATLLQAEVKRKARRRWARLRAAWQGE